MPTVITHGVVALVGGAACYPKRIPLRFWILALFCSMAPDLDVLLFSFGAEYGDLWGHRGLSHSLSFALGLALVVATLAFRRYAPIFRGRWWGLVLFFFALTASHGVLDALTNGGLGVAFFSPFDPTRYFLPWSPIQVSPIGARSFFSAWGRNVLVSEMVWVWAPTVILGAGVWIVRRKTAPRP